MSHHDKITHVEVLFLDRRGKYVPGQLATLPVDNWLLSLFRGKPSIEIVNPSHLVFNENATGLHDIWVEDAPKIVEVQKEEPKKEESKSPRLKFESINDGKFAVSQAKDEDESSESE